MRLFKTEKGVEEIQKRQHKLGSKPRMVLMLVDSEPTYARLSECARAIGVDVSVVDDLLRDGFIRSEMDASPSQLGHITEIIEEASLGNKNDVFAQFRAASTFMTESIFSAVGLKSFFFSLKIDRASTLEDLQALSEDYSKSMVKVLGEAGAAPFLRRMKQLLDPKPSAQ